MGLVVRAARAVWSFVAAVVVGRPPRRVGEGGDPAAGLALEQQRAHARATTTSSQIGGIGG